MPDDCPRGHALRDTSVLQQRCQSVVLRLKMREAHAL